MLSVRKGLFGLAYKYNKNLIQSSNFSIFNKIQASNLKFTPKHEWISLNGDVGTIGVSDYAQDKLGEVVYMELAAKGKKLGKGDAFCTLESVKAVSECYMPVSGTIHELNSTLSETPSLINKSPFDQGWLVKVKVDNVTDVDSLMSEDQYKEYLKTADH